MIGTLQTEPARDRPDLLAAPVAGTATAPLVFVGHGWVIKAKNIDAYQGVDVKDKIMIVERSVIERFGEHHVN